MTLHDYLVQNKVFLDNKQEMALGMIIAQKFKERYKRACKKIEVEYFNEKFPVNDYEYWFLRQNELHIIKFLTQLQTTKP